VPRRLQGLPRSLKNPHPQAIALADLGLDSWATNLPADPGGLVDITAGTSARWVEGEGWVVDHGLALDR